MVLLWAGRGMTLAGRPRNSSATWGCAYAETSSRMQYTASSYASPLLDTFGPVSGIRKERTLVSFHTHAIELVLDRLGRPLWRGLVILGTRLHTLQTGSLRRYLLYAILCVLGLLLYVRFQTLP
jgi:hypothetical protein